MSELSINLLFPVLNERLRLENGIEKTVIECHSRIGALGPYKNIIGMSMEPAD